MDIDNSNSNATTTTTNGVGISGGSINNSNNYNNMNNISSNEEEDFCRVCRNGSTPDNPLSYPCKCSGSIKYIHQDCLLTWIQHSKSSSCELCGHPFRFTPIYSDNAPETIPFHELMFEALKRLKLYIKKFARLVYLAFCWLFVVPTLTCWAFNFYFGQKWSILQNRGDSPFNLFYDFFIGTMLFFWIILTSTLSIMIVDFLEHKQEEIDSQEAIENQDAQTAAANNLANLNIHERHLLHQQQLRQQQQAQQQQQQAGQVLFRIPGVFEMLRFDNAIDINNNNNNNNNNNVNINQNNNNNNDEDDDNQNPDQQQQQPQQPNLGDEQNDDLGHFIGLSGPLSKILINCFIVIIANATFIALFLYIPFLIGQTFSNLSLNVVKQHLKLGIISDGIFNVGVGYCILSVLCLLVLSLMITKKIALKFSVLFHSFIKLSMITCIDLCVLPIVVGFFIDLCSLLLFGSTVANRIEYALANKSQFILTRWGFGIFFMMNFAYLRISLRQILRKGVFDFFERDDPDFDRSKAIIKNSIAQEFKRRLKNLLLSVCLGLLFVYLPTKFLSLIPDLLPINLHFGDPLHKGSADMLCK